MLGSSGGTWGGGVLALLPVLLAGHHSQRAGNLGRIEKKVSVRAPGQCILCVWFYEGSALNTSTFPSSDIQEENGNRYQVN